VNAALQLCFPLIIFKGATPLLTPLHTSYSSRTNPRGGLVGNSFKVIRGQSCGESRELEESLNLVDFEPSIKLNLMVDKSNWLKGIAWP
jgi:hypothetical protein